MVRLGVVMGSASRHQDIGRRIDFGGPSIVIMEPFGPAGDYSGAVVAPYQVKNAKRCYRKGKNTPKLRYFSGGYLQKSGSLQSIEGGSWYGGGRIALSWSRTTIYARGKFVDAAAHLPGGVYGIDWQIVCVAACDAQVAKDLLPSFPQRDLITDTVIVLYRTNAPLATWQYRWRRFALIDLPGSGDVLTLQPIAGDYAVPGTYPVFRTYPTLMSSDASAFALYVEPYASVDSFPSDQQHIHYVTFNAARDAATVSTIVSDDVDHITITQSTSYVGSNYLWDMTGSRSGSLTPGGWALSHVTMGPDALYAVGQKHVSYASASTDERRSIGESGGRPGYANHESSESRTITTALLRITFAGVVSVVKQWQNTSTSTSVIEQSYNNGAYSRTVDDQSTTDGEQVLFLLSDPPGVVVRGDYGSIDTQSSTVTISGELSTTGTRTLSGDKGLVVYRPAGDVDHLSPYSTTQSLDAVDTDPNWSSVYADMYADVGAGYSTSGSYTSRFLASQITPRASAVLGDEVMWHELDATNNTWRTHYIHGTGYTQFTDLIAYPDGTKPSPASQSFLSQIAIAAG